MLTKKIVIRRTVSVETDGRSLDPFTPVEKEGLVTTTSTLKSGSASRGPSVPGGELTFPPL